MGIDRVYVEKKQGFDGQALRLLKELKENLELERLTGLRILNRYDIEGLTGVQLEQAVRLVLSEPNQDVVYYEDLPAQPDDQVVGICYLPGQYDQRADSAAQCIQLITQQEAPVVETARIYVLEGADQEEAGRVLDYLLNPVDSRPASLDKPRQLGTPAGVPADVEVLEGFNDLGPQQLEEFLRQRGLAMGQEDLAFCQNYFRSLGRVPTITEIRVIDTYWSDHCRHTTFHTVLEKVDFSDDREGRLAAPVFEEYLKLRSGLYGEKAEDRPVCLMDLAVIGMKELKRQGKLPDLDVSDEINACSIVVPAEVDGRQEDWLVMFKNETHNHPTEIEPFGGAATCLGGAIRDPLSGRAYVYQAMRVTGSGDPRVPVSETLPGKLPQRRITTEAAHGYSSYGNQIGLATGCVEEFYHPGFVAKRMEVGAVVGAVPRDQVVRQVPKPGDVVILVGGPTGRDGCGGATGSSREHDEDSILTCGAEVQKGNPPVERKLQRLFKDPECSRLILKCNDFGAGGVSVAVGELTGSLRIHLDRVPLKYQGLDGTELAISESQERMAVVVSRENADRFIELADRENLEAVVVADVTANGRLEMIWRGKTIVELDRDFLDTNGVRQYARALVSADPEAPDYFSWDCRFSQEDWKGDWLGRMGDLRVSSRRGLVERFDSTIGSATVLMPLGGKYQATPTEGMAAKLPVEGSTETATVMTFGYDPWLMEWSPFLGAQHAVAESAVKAVCLGADWRSLRLSFQEYFEKLGDDPRRWGKPLSALLGALSAQLGLGLAAIGGKDSMSGTFRDLSVPPTLISFACGAARAGNLRSHELRRVGSRLFYIPCPRDEQFRILFDILIRNLDLVRDGLADGRILSAAPVKGGGLAETISKMAFGNRLGVELEVPAPLLGLPDPGGMVLELAEEIPELKGIFLGRVLEAQVIRLEGEELFLGEVLSAWENPLSGVFPPRPDTWPEPARQLSWSRPSGMSPRVGDSRPRVFIPVFPGTNCEYDSARAFARAGGDPVSLVFRNRNPEQVEESIQAMAREIRRSRIIMIPGGFSAGDEPDGSGKFIAAVFRSPRIREEVMELLNGRDGLILGICNGFQALIKLGLLPYGEIRDLEPEDPTLTYNTIGRHISGYVSTRVSSVLSPWLSETSLGDMHRIAVSHGEGRFVATDEAMDRLIAAGQVATQYVDALGMAASRPPYNPNGSLMAVEGISSPDGRILGKMGHSERVGDHVAVNLPGPGDQGIFRAGVRYFSL